MLDLRLKSFEIFQKNLYWPNLKKLDLEKIYFYWKVENNDSFSSWDEVPNNIKNTFDRLWIPEAEKKILAWVWAQYDSQTIYHNLKDELKNLWVIFEDLSIALQNKKYEKIIKIIFQNVFL